MTFRYAFAPQHRVADVVAAASAVVVLERLSGGTELSASQLREELTELAGQVSRYEHKPYAAVGHVAPQVLAWLGAAGDLVRGRNAGHWRISRLLWTRMDDWLGGPVIRSGVRDGYARLVAAYLRAFGPVTERDLVWWFGATKGAVRQARDSGKLPGSGPGSYRFVEHRRYLDALLAELDVRERVTLIVQDWGSGLGFDWASRRHPAACRRPPPPAASRRLLKHPEHEPYGAIDFVGFFAIQTSGEITKPASIDGAQLINQYPCPGTAHVDLRPEDRRLSTGRRWCDDQRREPDAITLHRDGIPLPALLMTLSLLVRAEAVDVTTH
jgi:hypothetical protein